MYYTNADFKKPVGFHQVDYVKTSFQKEFKNKTGADELDKILDFPPEYSRTLIRLHDGKYNIIDDKYNDPQFNNSVDLKEAGKAVFGEIMTLFLDYDKNGYLIDNVIKNGVESIDNTFENYIAIGKNLNLLTTNKESEYRKVYNDSIQFAIDNKLIEDGKNLSSPEHEI